MDIDESLTYGTRRATVPAKVVKREVKKNEETGEVFWEDNVKPLSGKLEGQKSQDWKEMKKKVRRSSLNSQMRRIDKVSTSIFLCFLSGPWKKVEQKK